MEHSDFLHFIITRFNLPLWPKALSAKPSASTRNAYLDERLEIFQKYCFPSIKNQRNQNFRWLLLFDEDTPQYIKNQISTLQAQFENLLPCYIPIASYSGFSRKYIELFNEYSNIVGAGKYPNISESERIQRILTPDYLSNYITQFASPATKYVLTTRLDNDDAFHRDYIGDIQQRFLLEKRACLYNYLWGFQYSHVRQIAQKYYYPNNHFTTLVEQWPGTLQTALYWDHRFVQHFVELVNVDTIPMWMELLHGNNVGNQYRISVKNRPVLNLPHAHFSYPEVPISKKNTLFFALKPSTIKGYFSEQ